MNRMIFEHIGRNPEVMNGQPCIKGTRLTVTRALSAIAAYPKREELLENYPELSEANISEVLAYAAAMVADESIDLAESR